MRLDEKEINRSRCTCTSVCPSLPSVSAVVAFWESVHLFRNLFGVELPIPRENGKQGGCCPAALHCGTPAARSFRTVSLLKPRIVAASSVLTSLGKSETSGAS